MNAENRKKYSMHINLCSMFISSLSIDIEKLGILLIALYFIITAVVAVLHGIAIIIIIVIVAVIRNGVPLQ